MKPSLSWTSHPLPSNLPVPSPSSALLAPHLPKPLSALFPHASSPISRDTLFTSLLNLHPSLPPHPHLLLLFLSDPAPHVALLTWTLHQSKLPPLTLHLLTLFPPPSSLLLSFFTEHVHSPPPTLFPLMTSLVATFPPTLIIPLFAPSVRLFLPTSLHAHLIANLRAESLPFALHCLVHKAMPELPDLPPIPTAERTFLATALGIRDLTLPTGRDAVIACARILPELRPEEVSNLFRVGGQAFASVGARAVLVSKEGLYEMCDGWEIVDDDQVSGVLIIARQVLDCIKERGRRRVRQCVNVLNGRVGSK